MRRLTRKLAALSLCISMVFSSTSNLYAKDDKAFLNIMNSIPFIDKLFPPDKSPLTSPILQRLSLSLDFKNILPNETGQIMVLMYHGLDKDVQSAPYMRTIAGFKSDLQALYDNGFRPISVEDYINNDIKVAAGFTPVVITFDDGLSTAFSFEEENGKLVPAKDCAVDIMNKFAEEHPDFGKAAVFYINGTGRPSFHGKGTLEERFKYLVDNGYELGNHTYSHPMLSKLSSEKVQMELAKLEKLVNETLPGYKMLSVAYPYGERPKKYLRDLALKGSYDGTSYEYKIAFRASPISQTATPNNVGFDIINAPRVRGTDCASTDLGWQIRKYKENPELKYISDGNPDVISVPAKATQYIDAQNLNGKVLNIYDLEHSQEKK